MHNSLAKPKAGYTSLPIRILRRLVCVHHRQEPASVKSFIRFLGLVLCLSGWVVVAFCVHVVRIPDPANAQQSKLIVVPKNRLNLEDTYVDARVWTMADVKTHPLLIFRLMKLGKADDLKFLADPKSNKDIETQLTDAISDSSDGGNGSSPTTSRTSIRPAGFSH